MCVCGVDCVCVCVCVFVWVGVGVGRFGAEVATHRLGRVCVSGDRESFSVCASQGDIECVYRCICVFVFVCVCGCVVDWVCVWCVCSCGYVWAWDVLEPSRHAWPGARACVSRW